MFTSFWGVDLLFKSIIGLQVGQYISLMQITRLTLLSVKLCPFHLSSESVMVDLFIFFTFCQKLK